jgi:hypothetical protein
MRVISMSVEDERGAGDIADAAEQKGRRGTTR